MPVEVVCEKCERTESIRMGHWSTHCRNPDCNVEKPALLLAPVTKGKRYVQIKCVQSWIDCVDTADYFAKCKCCKEKAVEFSIDSMVVEIRNKQNVYGTTQATAFIRRRCKEMMETRRTLETVIVGLGEHGVKTPEMKPRSGDIYGTVDLPPNCDSKRYVAACDTCGVKTKIPAGTAGGTCENKHCTGHKTVVRPLPDSLKYIHIKCEKTKKSWCSPRFATTTFVTCDCCDLEYAVDSIVSLVINNQPIYGCVPSTGFIKRQYMDLALMREQLDIAQKELDRLTKKNSKKPSLWKRMCSRIRQFFTLAKGNKPMFNNNEMKLYLL